MFHVEHSSAKSPQDVPRGTFAPVSFPPTARIRSPLAKMFHVEHSSAKSPQDVPRGTFAPVSLHSDSSNPLSFGQNVPRGTFAPVSFPRQLESALLWLKCSTWNIRTPNPSSCNVSRGTFADETTQRLNWIRFSTFCRFLSPLLFFPDFAGNPWLVRHLPDSASRPP